MRFLRQSLLGVLLAALTLALLVYAVQIVASAVQTRLSTVVEPPRARERVFPVTVVQAVPATVEPVLDTFGQIQSRRTLELRAAVQGRVIDLADSFVEGGSVEAGQVLVQIDPADAKAELARAENDLMDAEAEQRDAERSLDLSRDELAAAQEQADVRDRAFQRQQGLSDRGVATAATLETAELAAASARQAVVASRRALAQAEARVDQAATGLTRAQIAVDDARRTLDETTVTAAFDATLGDVSLVTGRLVSANEKLAVLVDPGALEVAFRVSTGQYARLLDDSGTLLNLPVQARLDVGGADLRATGTISRDSAEIGEGLSGRMVYARLDAPRGFKPGDFVTVEVREPPIDDVIRVAASALDAAGTVLVVGEDNRLERLPVTLVRRQGDDVLLRGEGLAGRDVGIGGTPLLGAGIQVRPQRQGAAPAPAPTDEMLTLSSERRAQLVAMVEANNRMPAEVKERVLTQLGGDQVPANLVQRIESRMGG